MSNPINPIQSITLPKINVKNSTSSVILTNQIQSSVINDIKANIPNFSVLQADIGFLQYICNIVELLVPIGNSKSKNGIDKKAIVINIMTQLFSLSPDQQTQTGNLIEHLLDSKLIKPKKSKLISFFSSSLKIAKKFL